MKNQSLFKRISTKIEDAYIKIMYGNKWLELKKIDSVLDLFFKRRTMPKDIMYSHNSPEGWCDVVDFLLSECLIEEKFNELSITEKGILKHKEGGYMGECRKKKIELFSIVLGIIVSIFTLLTIL